MATITKLEFKGFTVEVQSDLIWMTVYDPCGEPCGTLERPHWQRPKWAAHAPTGQQLTTDTCAGPRHALRSLAIYHGA